MEDIIDTAIHASDSDLVITNSMRDNLLKSAKWGNFLAILGFIGCGLMIIGALFMLFSNSYLGGSQLAVMGVTYIIMALLYFVPSLYLYKFSLNSKQGLMSESQVKLDEGIEFLAKQYQFLGIVAIVVLSLFVLLLIGGLIFGSMAGAF